jgi:hypothetical protein
LKGFFWGISGSENRRTKLQAFSLDVLGENLLSQVLL